PLATIGDVLAPTVFCHWTARLGLPAPSIISRSPDSPRLVETKIQTLPFAGSFQTGIAVKTPPPCGTLTIAISPPVWPGPPCPLRLSRFNRRSVASLPPCTPRWGKRLPAGAGRIAGTVLPTSASALSSDWKLVGV